MREIKIDNQGVEMKAGRQMRLRHVSDTPGDREECFGGDTMGHWNVARINRLLVGFNAPVLEIPIPNASMLEMAKVGAPDRVRAGAYAALGAALMPPLSFVSFMNDEDGIQLLLVDGHHRMMALWLLGATSVPARVLPPTIVDDVRIVEIGEVAVFPAFTLPKNKLQVAPRERAA